MRFESWLTRWLAQHPLRVPVNPDRSRYTAEVMAQVKALGQLAPAGVTSKPGPIPAPMPARRWMPWPRLALTGATVCVGMAIAIGIMRGSSGRLVEQIAQDSRLLAELAGPDTSAWWVLEEPANGSSGGDLEALAEELETVDALLLLAEAPADEDPWIEETLQFLEEFDEEVPEGLSDEDWLDELEQLDEDELANS